METMQTIPIVIFALLVFIFVATDIGSGAGNLLYNIAKSFFSDQYVTRV